jgi:hypothetical protein
MMGGGMRPPGMMGGMPQMQNMRMGSMGGPGAGMMPMGSGQGMSGMMGSRMGPSPKEKADPVSDAEAALKKLRANPGDREATKALERALKRLKEREKQNPPSEGEPE